MAGVLIIFPSQIDHLRREALAAYPLECCGMIVGRDEPTGRVVTQLYPVENVAPEVERRKRFVIDPLTLLRIERELDKSPSGDRIIGFYHSHPDAPAVPSETDRQAAWAFYSYVIVSVTRDEVEAVQSWVLRDADRRFETQPISLPNS